MIEDYDALEREGKLTGQQALWREGLRSFIRLKPQFAGSGNLDARSRAGFAIQE